MVGLFLDCEFFSPLSPIVMGGLNGMKVLGLVVLRIKEPSLERWGFFGFDDLALI